MVKVAILGGSGYTAAELIKILLRHPSAEIVAVTSRQQGTPLVAEQHPSLAASFVLTDMSGKTVTEGSQTSLTAYNVTSSPYATLVAQQDADKRAAQDIAQRIRLDLAAFFRQQRR